MTRWAPLSLLSLLSLSLLAGCDRLDRFALEPGEAYCGAVTLGAGYRQGLSPRVQMRLRWDAAQFAAGASPGTITTFDGGADEGAQHLVDEAALRPIEPLVHDPLSDLEFGDGREQNLVYGLSAADPQAESFLAIVSLRSDSQIEVRLLRAGTPELGEVKGREPVFGLFLLSRQPSACF